MSRLHDSTAIFTLLNALLLRSLPYQDPARRLHVWETVRREVLRSVILLSRLPRRP